MAPNRPLTLLLLGWACTFSSGALLVLLVMNKAGEAATVFAARAGDEAAMASLAKQNLQLGSRLAVEWGLASAQVACLLLICITGVGLARAWWAARWSSLACVIAAIPLAIYHTVFRLSELRVAGEPAQVAPLLLDAGVILLSINLCGTVFLPDVARALSPAPRPQAGVAAGHQSMREFS
jgi:hypothetical protein